MVSAVAKVTLESQAAGLGLALGQYVERLAAERLQGWCAAWASQYLEETFLLFVLKVI